MTTKSTTRPVSPALGVLLGLVAGKLAGVTPATRLAGGLHGYATQRFWAPPARRG